MYWTLLIWANSPSFHRTRVSLLLSKQAGAESRDRSHQSTPSNTVHGQRLTSVQQDSPIFFTLRTTQSFSVCTTSRQYCTGAEKFMTLRDQGIGQREKEDIPLHAYACCLYLAGAHGRNKWPGYPHNPRLAVLEWFPYIPLCVHTCGYYGQASLLLLTMSSICAAVSVWRRLSTNFCQNSTMCEAEPGTFSSIYTVHTW